MASLFGFFNKDFQFFWVGLAAFISGIWANMSLVRIRFDLKSRTYRRRQGPGLIPRLWQGSIDELDALVVIAELSVIAPGSFRYHLVLHWKQHKAPLMVLESEIRASNGGPQQGGQYLLSKATKYAMSMRLPVYDNSHYVQSCPVPVWS
jgi:hypothetical protein